MCLLLNSEQWLMLHVLHKRTFSPFIYTHLNFIVKVTHPEKCLDILNRLTLSFVCEYVANGIECMHMHNHCSHVGHVKGSRCSPDIIHTFQIPLIKHVLYTSEEETTSIEKPIFEDQYHALDELLVHSVYTRIYINDTPTRCPVRKGFFYRCDLS